MAPLFLMASLFVEKISSNLISQELCVLEVEEE
jgi:hypothetical protein